MSSFDFDLVVIGSGPSGRAAAIQAGKLKRRVLVVDDSPSIRYALSDLLNLHGYKVNVVGTVQEGLEAARVGRYDIAVIDYYLQEATGDELVRQFMHGMADGPVAFHYSAPNYAEQLLGRDAE